MAANIEWASPKITECWSYDGRLYRFEKKARFERDQTLKYRNEYLKKNPNNSFPSHWTDLPPIYRVRWEWNAE